MEQKVIAYIEKYNMLQKKDRVVVGVSGGADSVCLFFVLLKLREEYDLELFAVHVNHGIRGRDSDEDQAFVEALCKTRQVACISVKKDIRSYGKNLSISEEEAGRRIRYEIFQEIYEEKHCTKIAVAHNMNDNAETMFFNLARGSGLKGIGGIPSVRNHIIRPLLCVKREEILEYLNELGQSWRIDATNASMDYARNRIRHKIIPVMEQEINVKTVEHMKDTAQYVREIQNYIEKNAKAAFEQIVQKANGQYLLKIGAFQREDVVMQKEILKEALSLLAGGLKDFEGCHIEMLLKLSRMEAGKKVHLPYGLEGRRDYHHLILYKPEAMEILEEDYEFPITDSGIYQIPGMDASLSVTIENAENNLDEIPKNDYTKWFDYDKICHAVSLRNRREGDYFQSTREGGRKKLKDYFIDTKVPRNERNQIPLLADESHIIWVIGGRISEKYKVTEDTVKILKVRLIGGKKDE